MTSKGLKSGSITSRLLSVERESKKNWLNNQIAEDDLNLIHKHISELKGDLKLLEASQQNLSVALQMLEDKPRGLGRLLPRKSKIYPSVSVYGTPSQKRKYRKKGKSKNRSRKSRGKVKQITKHVPATPLPPEWTKALKENEEMYKKKRKRTPSPPRSRKKSKSAIRRL